MSTQHTIEQLRIAWLEGNDARQAGAKPWHNPYGLLAESEAARLWEAGFLSGDLQTAEDDYGDN